MQGLEIKGNKLADAKYVKPNDFSGRYLTPDNTYIPIEIYET